MTTLTEAELREYWRSGKGQLPPFPEGTRFSPAALDFLNELQRQGALILPRETAQSAAPAWDKPAGFPIERSSAARKPGDATQLSADSFGSKSDPRIALRGRLDTLNASFLLAASLAKSQRLNEAARLIDTLGAYCREIASAEYQGRKPAPLELAGMDEDSLHAASHDPAKILGHPHLAPDSSSPGLLLRLNELRALTREVELAALPLQRPDLAHALNRLSSAVYVLEIILARAFETRSQPGAPQ